VGFADIGWKESLEHYLEPAMALLFRDAHAQIDWSRGYEFLDKEPQQIVREGELGSRLVDKLAKVFLKNGEEHWVLVHVDVQDNPQKLFGRRMYAYNYRIFDRYNRLVASFAILTDDQPDWRPDGFGYSLLGCTVGFRFPTAKLLDFVGKEAELETSDNLFALVVLAFLKARQTNDDVNQRRLWKLRLIRGLYDRGLSRKDVQQLFRLIHWFMVLPKEVENEVWRNVQAIEKEKQMPYMTTLEEMWLENGVKKGRADALAEGESVRHKLLAETIEIAVRLKFGPDVAASVMPELQAASAARLEQTKATIEKIASLDELHQLLATTEN